MAKVLVSREARKDLLSIQAYIRDELQKPDASGRVPGELKKAVLSLQDMPMREKPLDSVITVHTEYRFLVCEQDRIFCLSDGESVEVIRIPVTTKQSDATLTDREPSGSFLYPFFAETALPRPPKGTRGMIFH